MKSLLGGALFLFATSSFIPYSHAELIGNADFENEWSGGHTGGYIYRPTEENGDLAWTFTGGGGLTPSYSAWGGVADSGESFAFLQSKSSIYQTFTLSETSFLTLDFSWMARPVHPATENFTVKIDNYVVFDITTTSYEWVRESLTLGNLSAGTYTLTFSTVPYGPDDQSAFLDDVSLTADSPSLTLDTLQYLYEVPTPLAFVSSLALIPLFRRPRKNGQKKAID
jgi:hypothetical protein